ncbi:hypothetical protein [Thermus sp.]|jgi:hypothetical protein|uniref:hypothetical protein n=1 Tax=Thermus sp. TaxID=275 RepID=UPI003D0B5C31
MGEAARALPVSLTGRKVGEDVAQEVRTEGRLLLPCVDAPLDLAALYEGVELERA